ncbi:MAG: hypothetical protein PHG69_05970 [Candidatus Omnitrophica bacterium]|nr:hypothetical protein [Candidatus Omnitrophota bacterium]
MDNSILLAKFIGPYIMVISIGLLFNSKAFQKIMEDFSKNSALVYVAGLITFVAGLTVTLFHNFWVLDWRIIITLLGWNMFIKGAWLIISPDTSAKMAASFAKNNKLVIILWVIMLAIGVFLTTKGYRIGTCPVF